MWVVYTHEYETLVTTSDKWKARKFVYDLSKVGITAKIRRSK